MKYILFILLLAGCRKINPIEKETPQLSFELIGDSYSIACDTSLDIRGIVCLGDGDDGNMVEISDCVKNKNCTSFTLFDSLKPIFFKWKT